MKVKDKIELLKKGVSLKDIKELEEQEALEAQEDESAEENQDNSEDNKPEEESSDDQIEQLTQAVAAAVVEKLQLDNLHMDRSTDTPTSRTVEEVAQSIFKPKLKNKKGDK